MEGVRPLFSSRMTVVSIRKDEEHNAYLTRAEGPFGMRMSWLSEGKPDYMVGDEFSIRLRWSDRLKEDSDDSSS